MTSAGASSLGLWPVASPQPSLPPLGVCCLVTQAAGLPLSSLIISFLKQGHDVGVILTLFIDEKNPDQRG